MDVLEGANTRMCDRASSEGKACATFVDCTCLVRMADCSEDWLSGIRDSD